MVNHNELTATRIEDEIDNEISVIEEIGLDKEVQMSILSCFNVHATRRLYYRA